MINKKQVTVKPPNYFLNCWHRGEKIWNDILPYLGKAYGMCNKYPDGNYDYSFLKSKNLNNDSKLNIIITNDEDKIKNHVYLLAGGYSELNAEFNIAYTSYGHSLFKDYIYNFPMEFFTRYKQALLDVFLIEGSEYLFNPVYEFSENQSYLFNKIIGNIIRPFFIFGFSVSFMFIIFSWFFKDSFLIILSQISLNALLLNSMTCCENSRMFLPFSGVYFLISIIVINNIILFLRTKFQRRFIT
jgi:hypothetical protein